VLMLRCARLFPPPRYATRRFSTSVLLFYSPNSQPTACFSLHFQVYSVPGPPAALVVRFARLSPPPRHRTRRFSSPVLFTFSTLCVFCTALLGLFCAETACGASAALHALIPATKAKDAQIQATPSGHIQQIVPLLTIQEASGGYENSTQRKGHHPPFRPP
jgi:hypothetical protein